MDYNKIENQIIKLFENTKFCTLATASKDGVVSASQVCLVSDGLVVYVQTDKTFEKVKNIKENSNVALNLGAYYFKGNAEIVGHPTENADFIEKIKEKHLDTYNHYTNLQNEVLIKIKLTQAKIWGAGNISDIHNQETILVVDFKTKELQTIVCDKM